MPRKQKPRRFETTLLFRGEEREVVVEFFYYPATRDVMYLPNGDPGYPGDPEEIEVMSITTKDNNQSIDPAHLSEEATKALNEAIGLHASEEDREAEEERADAWAQSREWDREHREEISRAIKEQ